MSTDTKESILMKKNESINKVEELVYEDRLYVLQILKQHLPVSQIKEHADGCRINLDDLSDDLIHKIHHIIITKLEVLDVNKI